MNDLEQIRKDINSIDSQMAQLYEKRMQLMKDVAAAKRALKKSVFDKEREEKVKEKNAEYIQDPDLKELYKAFIQFIMDQGKDIQNKILENE